jgi:phospholipid/cholesterol/gamma-HCH transport system permease protein
MSNGAEGNVLPPDPAQGAGQGVPVLRAGVVMVESLGQQVIEFITQLGGLVEMVVLSIYWLVRPPYRVDVYFDQLEFVGVGSVFVVGLTGLFTGMVFAVQSYTAFSLFNAQSLVGSTVALALARELGPVFAGFMVTARVGSAMATELGSMKVTEQIDALVTMAVDPVQYLVVPRLVATVLMMPVLAMLFGVIGISGAYFVTVVQEGISTGVFLGRIHAYVDPPDIIGGLIKAAAFGFFIAIISCYKGMNAKGGARGVGEATTQAVVLSSVTVLVADYFLSLALQSYWTKG